MAGKAVNSNTRVTGFESRHCKCIKNGPTPASFSFIFICFRNCRISTTNISNVYQTIVNVVEKPEMMKKRPIFNFVGHTGTMGQSPFNVIGPS